MILGTCLHANEKPAEIQWDIKLEKAHARMVEQQRPMLMYLTVPGCLFCNKMKQNTLSQQEFVQRVSKQFVPIEINGREQRELVEALRVRVYPSLAIVSPQGRVIDLVKGYQSPQQLRQRLQRIEAKLKTRVAAKPVSAKPATQQK